MADTTIITVEVAPIIEGINGGATGTIINRIITLLNFRRPTNVREAITEVEVDGTTTIIHIMDVISEVTKIKVHKPLCVLLVLLLVLS